MVGKVKNKELLALKLIMLGVILIIGLYNLPNEKVIYITSDELGYWAAAAHFAKLDWSGVSSMWPYYAYGYGMLLAPIYMITKNAIWVYRIAIVLNALFLCGSFIVLNELGQRMLRNMGKKFILLVSFCITLYSSSVFFAHMTMTEPLLWFGFCCLALLLLDLIKNPKKINCIFSAILLAYLYMVHRRVVFVIISSAMLMLLLVFTKKIKVKHLMIWAGTLGVFLILSVILKNDITSALYTNPVLAGGNDYAAQTDKVVAIFTLEGFKQLCTSILGKIYYLGAASFFLFYWGIWFILKKVKRYLLAIIKKDSQLDGEEYIFLLLTFLGIMAISAITMMSFGRIDILLYGRYIEFVMAPILLCGIYELYRNKNRWKLFTIFIIIQISLTFLVFLVLKQWDPQGLVSPSIIGIYGMFKNNGNVEDKTFEFLVTAKVLAASFGLCLLISKYRIRRVLYTTLGILGLTCIWVNLGLKPIEDTEGRKEQIDSMAMAEEIKNNNGGDIIYYVSNEVDRGCGYDYTYIAYVQFLLPDRQVKCIDYSELESVDKAKYVITMSESSSVHQLSGSYDLVYSDEFNLFRIKE